MKIALAAVCGVLAVAPPAMAAHAQDDDCEQAEDAGQQLSIAAVRYDGGSMVVVQCKAGALTAVVTGLPRRPEASAKAIRSSLRMAR